jgi:hypothetical protein
MRFSSNLSRTLVVGAAAGVAAIVLIVLAVAGVFSGGSDMVGHVDVQTAASVSPEAAPESQLYPFGKPSDKPDYRVPQPVGQPTAVPTFGTKTTQRIFGSNPFEEAVSVTQHIWPSVLPENAKGENDNDPDRPWALTLITPDDPLVAITSTPLIHFPDDAPVLYVTKNGIPKVTLNEIKRLGDTGISRYKNVDAFLVGDAANAKVKQQLKDLGLVTASVTAPNTPALANTVDKLYGKISNPDTGVPTMGNGMANVMIGSMDGQDYKYALPATHWVSHMATGFGWVHRGSVPNATIDMLQRRGGMARIYLWGGSSQISSKVADRLSKYGTVVRITNDDPVAFNAPPKDNPIDTAIAFAKMWDGAGEVGWKITGPGHGFTLVNEDDWQGAVASAPLSHLGFHAPLLLTDNSGKLSPELEAYYKSVAPTYEDTPADGPYNMHYIVGSWNQLTWPLQAHVDYISEMGNRRLWKQNTGGRYSDSQE